MSKQNKKNTNNKSKSSIKTLGQTPQKPTNGNKQEQAKQESREQTKTKSYNMMGFNSDSIADVRVEEIVNDIAAIKMLVHRIKELIDENISLRSDKNRLETYVYAYDRKKSNAVTSTILIALSNILIGFGINLLTAYNNWPGGVLLGCGVLLTATGMYFTFIKE